MAGLGPSGWNALCTLLVLWYKQSTQKYRERWAIGQCGVHVADLAVLSGSHVGCSVQGHHSLDYQFVRHRRQQTISRREKRTKLYQRTQYKTVSTHTILYQRTHYKTVSTHTVKTVSKHTKGSEERLFWLDNTEHAQIFCEKNPFQTPHKQMKFHVTGPVSWKSSSH